jgi:hypothetical protein
MVNIDKLEKYKKYVNEIWKIYNKKSFFPPNNKHIFIRDMESVDKLVSDYYEEQKPIATQKTIATQNNSALITGNNKINSSLSDWNKLFIKGKCKFVPKKILPKKLVDEIFQNFTKYGSSLEWEIIIKQLDQMSEYLLYSNVDRDQIKNIYADKTNDTINILILGAGPTGLYLANYLNTINIISPKINLVIIDNRISENKEGYRLPYTRSRLYGLYLALFSIFFPKFPCIKELIKRGGIEIKYLEYIMIIFIYGLNIPIYFSNETNDKKQLENFLTKNKIDILFDCTGGRLKHEFIIEPINDNILDFYPANTIFSNDKYEVIYNNNEYRLQWKNNIDNRFFLTIEVFDDKGKYIYSPITTHNIFYAQDVIFFAKFHNKCLKIKPKKINRIIELFDNINDLKLAKKTQSVLLENFNKNIKFFIIEAEMYNKISIASIIKQPNQNTIYIGAGNTIFSSHFVVGAGLNRLLPFINNVVWYIQTLSKI